MLLKVSYERILCIRISKDQSKFMFHDKGTIVEWSSPEETN